MLMKLRWIFILTIVSFFQVNSYDLPIPHPIFNEEKCRSDGKHFFCDHLNLLSSSDVSEIIKSLDDVYFATDYSRIKCGKTDYGALIGVAVTDVIDPPSSKSMRSENAQKYADRIANAWNLQSEEDCQNGIIILVALSDKTIAIRTTSVTKKLLSSPQIEMIIKDTFSLFKKKKYAEAILLAIEKIHSSIKPISKLEIALYVVIGLVVVGCLISCCIHSAGRSTDNERILRVHNEIERLRNASPEEITQAGNCCPICLDEMDGQNATDLITTPNDHSPERMRQRKPGSFENDTSPSAPDKCALLSDQRANSAEHSMSLSTKPLVQRPPPATQTRDSDAVSAVCKHAFHRGCINNWLATNNTCPMCRRVIKGDSETEPQRTTEVTNNSNTVDRDFFIINTIDFLTHSLANRHGMTAGQMTTVLDSSNPIQTMNEWRQEHGGWWDRVATDNRGGEGGNDSSRDTWAGFGSSGGGGGGGGGGSWDD